MTVKLKVLELPVASTAITDSPVLRTAGSDLLLSMNFDDEGHIRATTLRFVKQRAFRKRSEIYCTGWHVTDAYDTVCEVAKSEWVQELRAASSAASSAVWVMRHFIIYVDSFGCLEVVAEDAVLDDSAKNSAGT